MKSPKLKQNQYDSKNGPKRWYTWGFTCGAFDFVHAGHVLMFKEAGNVCSKLCVFLQEDPSLDRPEKNKPVESLEERRIKLEACKYVEEVITYKTEEELVGLIKMFLKFQEHKNVIRILGEEYKTRHYTGEEIDIPVYFNSRDHEFSSTNLRERTVIAELMKGPITAGTMSGVVAFAPTTKTNKKPKWNFPSSK